MEKQMTVRVKRLNERAVLPVYGSACAAGADLCACIDATLAIGAGQTVFVPTGVAVELPPGTVGLVYARSGMACKRDLAPANKVGVIDSDYRGEIIVALHNHSGEDRRRYNGDRIAQIIITPYIRADFTQADSLSDTKRGVGGFGSTGN